MPILRAGLGMAEALLEILPSVRTWHLGLYRDHETLEPVTYYNELPPTPSIDVSFVLDPMLATGGSAIAAIDLLKKWGARRIKFLGLIAAPRRCKGAHRSSPMSPFTWRASIATSTKTPTSSPASATRGTGSLGLDDKVQGVAG